MKKAYAIGSFAVIILLSFFIFQKINLVTADLGRHITSGRLFIHASSLHISRIALLHTNFFSSTYPNYPFINHHWGSAIVLYFVYTLFGFSGLSFLYGGCIIGATLLLYFLWKDKLALFLIFPIFLLLLPLITDRTEVRPEGFSYLFMACIISILYKYINIDTHKYDGYLWIIPILSLIWINMHIYFIFSFFIVSIFLFELLIHKEYRKAKKIGIILGLSIVVSLINPYGFIGLVYPFSIFRNYGYLIVENQSIPLLLRLGIFKSSFFWWILCTVVFVISSVVACVKNRYQFPIALFLISSTFAILSFLGIRHFTAYGLVLFPTFSSYLHVVSKKHQSIEQKSIYLSLSLVVSFVLFFFILVISNDRMPWYTRIGFGLVPNILQSAQFVKTKNISGPYFSNYDIGGYIIFNNYPKKVFVDNRPEAYPNSFFKNTYVPMQTDERVWKRELIKWKFNAIWFHRNDLTHWAQEFLITRIKDPDWAPVFVDEQTIIFLKRNKNNAVLISKYELPKTMFNIR